jgi:hypothetical protein
MQIPERKSALEVKKLKHAFWGVDNKNLSQKRVSQSKILHCITLITYPIHANCNSIDAAQQARYDAKLKRSKFQSR